MPRTIDQVIGSGEAAKKGEGRPKTWSNDDGAPVSYAQPGEDRPMKSKRPIACDHGGPVQAGDAHAHARDV